MASTTGKKALHFGLAGHPTYPVSPEQIQAQVTEGADKARQAGYHVQLTFLNPEDLEAFLAGLANELQSGQWDAVIVGGGLRMTPPLTPQFERAINISREAAPKTKILFQAAPGDIYETLQRGFEGAS